MKYDSTLKINGILILAIIGMSLEDIMPNERSHTQKIM